MFPDLLFIRHRYSLTVPVSPNRTEKTYLVLKNKSNKHLCLKEQEVSVELYFGAVVFLGPGPGAWHRVALSKVCLDRCTDGRTEGGWMGGVGGGGEWMSMG